VVVVESTGEVCGARVRVPQGVVGVVLQERLEVPCAFFVSLAPRPPKKGTKSLVMLR